MLPVLSYGLLLLATRRTATFRLASGLMTSAATAQAVLNNPWSYDRPGPFGTTMQDGIKVSGSLRICRESVCNALICFAHQDTICLNVELQRATLHEIYISCTTFSPTNIMTYRPLVTSHSCSLFRLNESELPFGTCVYLLWESI
jgi:hypothetical protein